MPPLPLDPVIPSDGYNRAVAFLRQCATPDGFLASVTDRDNYRRVWARDGVVIGLAGLLTGDNDLKKGLLLTLRTLKQHQGPHGEISSNVDPAKGRVSYGGTTGRVDASLWFIIGCASYWRATGKDRRFLEEFFPAMERVEFLLGCWEFNNRGLLYVPQTGDWTDEYIQNGYVLYDQLLYWRALTDMNECSCAMHDEEDRLGIERVERLRDLIRANYWFLDSALDDPHAYHPVLYRKGFEAAEHRNRHWMAFFSPGGYGYRFDALANVLVSLFDIADDDQRGRVDKFIADEVVAKDMMLLPAFYPVIQPEDDMWNELQVSFSFTFKNKPYEFHNGGLWQFVTGFYVVDLAKRGRKDLAVRYLAGIDAANKLDATGDEWGFYEYIHGKDLTPCGTRRQGWSAAATIMGHHALQGSYIF